MWNVRVFLCYCYKTVGNRLHLPSLLPLPPLTILAEVQFHKACEVGNARRDAVEVILTDCQFAEVCQTKQFLGRGKKISNVIGG